MRTAASWCPDFLWMLLLRSRRGMPCKRRDVPVQEGISTVPPSSLNAILQNPKPSCPVPTSIGPGNHGPFLLSWAPLILARSCWLVLPMHMWLVSPSLLHNSENRGRDTSPASQPHACYILTTANCFKPFRRAGSELVSLSPSWIHPPRAQAHQQQGHRASQVLHSAPAQYRFVPEFHCAEKELLDDPCQCHQDLKCMGDHQL